MTQISGGEAFVRMLQLHGVKHIFGLCGDTSLPFYDAMCRLDHGMQHILTRDERSAAYMADGYARVSGRIGVCEGPSGGGATYILPGIVEANESSIPLLCFTSDISVSARGRYALTELDQQALFRPLTKWNTVLDAGADIPRVLRNAFKQMTTGRPGAAHIGLPYDVQKQMVDEADIWGDASLNQFPSRRACADAAAIAAAAKLLAQAQRPLFIVGGGVVISGAEEELIACAEILGAAVATASVPQTNAKTRRAPDNTPAGNTDVRSLRSLIMPGRRPRLPRVVRAAGPLEPLPKAARSESAPTLQPHIGQNDQVTSTPAVNMSP